MQIEITSEKNHPLFNRVEIAFVATDVKATPSRKDIVEKIASKKGVDAGCVVIEKLSPAFGSASAKGVCRIYPTAADAEKMESKHLITRTTGKGKAEAK